MLLRYVPGEVFSSIKDETFLLRTEFYYSLSVCLEQLKRMTFWIKTRTLFWQRHAQHGFLLVLQFRDHPLECVQALVDILHLQHKSYNLFFLYFRQWQRCFGKQLKMLSKSLPSSSHPSTADPVSIAFKRNFKSLVKVNIVSVWGTFCPWIMKQLDISRGQKTHHSVCNSWDRKPEPGATARATRQPQMLFMSINFTK